MTLTTLASEVGAIERSRHVAGEIVHIEIPGGADTRRACAFWSALFGWRFDTVSVPDAEYLLTRINDDQGAALSNFEPDKRGIRPYFAVGDIDADILRVTELRGEVCEKMAVPGAGWFALCRDPHGNQFGLWQSDPAAQPPNLDPALSEFRPGADRATGGRGAPAHALLRVELVERTHPSRTTRRQRSAGADGDNEAPRPEEPGPVV